MKKLFLVLLLFITVISLAQKDAYFEAIENNTIKSFNDFLNKYPDSKYENKIIAKLTVLEQPAYLNAVNINTVESYEKFLLDFPKSKRRKSIQNKLEMIAYYKIQFSRDIEKLAGYINKYPESKYCEPVTKKIEFLEVYKSGNIDELQAYIENNPTSEYSLVIINKLECYHAITEIEEKRQITDYYNIQTIMDAYISKKTELSGKDIISRIEISRITEIIWKTYTRIIIAVNSAYMNESMLNIELRNGQKEMLANLYYDVLLHFHFAKKLISDEKYVDVQNYGNTILASLDYGESFFKNYSKINELESYKLVFETIYEESKIDHLTHNLSKGNELENQFNEYRENVVFWFNLDEN